MVLPEKCQKALQKNTSTSGGGGGVFRLAWLAPKPPLADVRKTTYRTEGGLVVTLPRVPPAPSGANLTVTLEAMQIRAFLCTLA